jgi:hypothetical protein
MNISSGINAYTFKQFHKFTHIDLSMIKSEMEIYCFDNELGFKNNYIRWFVSFHISSGDRIIDQWIISLADASILVIGSLSYWSMNHFPSPLLVTELLCRWLAISQYFATDYNISSKVIVTMLLVNWLLSVNISLRYWVIDYFIIGHYITSLLVNWSDHCRD